MINNLHYFESLNNAKQVFDVVKKKGSTLLRITELVVRINFSSNIFCIGFYSNTIIDK